MRIPHDSINQEIRLYLLPIYELQTGVQMGGAALFFRVHGGPECREPGGWRMEALWKSVGCQGFRRFRKSKRSGRGHQLV